MSTLRINDSFKESAMLLALGVKSKETIDNVIAFGDDVEVNGETINDILDMKQKALFYAHLSHESEGFSDMKEDTNYSPQRAYNIWPKYFDDVDECQALMNEEGEEGLFNKVYGERLGNCEPEDGFRFIGRGYLNVTGRYNYERIGEMCNEDYADNPELLEEPEHAFKSSLAFIALDDRLYDELQRGSLRGSTREINGGLNGLVHRGDLYRDACKVLDDTVEAPDMAKYRSIGYFNTLLQYYLVTKGSDLKLDGHWGHGTQKEVARVFGSEKTYFTFEELQSIVEELT